MFEKLRLFKRISDVEKLEVERHNNDFEETLIEEYVPLNESCGNDIFLDRNKLFGCLRIYQKKKDEDGKFYLSLKLDIEDSVIKKLYKKVR